MIIGIYGFGRFGQFLAETITKYHTVVAYSRSDYSDIAQEFNVIYCKSINNFFKYKMDVLIIAVSILSFENVLITLKPYYKNISDTLIVDVLSVKMHAENMIKKYIPLNLYNIDYLATHPMFGPDSGWENNYMVYSPIRCNNLERISKFLDIFKEKKCKLILLNSEEHDKYCAESQFITHLTGRILGDLNLKDTPINTQGYNNLLNLIKNTCNDNFDLFNGLYKYNSESKEWLKKLRISLDNIEKKLECK